MPFLYAQVKERCDRCLIKHYLLDVPSLSQLRSFCNDESEVSRALHIPVQELVTFSPVYDNVVSGGGFADDVEFLEEEIYSGSLTNGIAKWLLQISEQSVNLLPGQFGMHLPGQDREDGPLETQGHLSLIVKSSHAIQCAVERQVDTFNIENTPNVTLPQTFLFRSIYLRIPKNWRDTERDIFIFERLESHVGKSPENARDLACNSGFQGAELDMKYMFPDSEVVFMGIESFTELPTMGDSPVLLACQTSEWPWKYDSKAFKDELLAETLEVNRRRQQEGLQPFWA